MPRKTEYWHLVGHGLCVNCYKEIGRGGPRRCPKCRLKHHQYGNREKTSSQVKFGSQLNSTADLDYYDSQNR